MRILLFSNLYLPEPTGIGPYSGGLAAELVRRGHQVSVLAANPSYPFWKLFEGFGAWRWSHRIENGVEVYRVPVYIPAMANGPRRILHYGSFAAAAAPIALYLATCFRPDRVIAIAPTLMAAPLALLTARLAGAASLLHVQDFEVEAGFATGQMTSGGRAARAALAFERWCIGAFSQVSSISPEMCAKLVEKGRNPSSVHELRNWAEIETVVPQPTETSVYRARWNIRTPHVALYSGSIAKKQGIEIVIDVARALERRGDITFVICGNGPTRSELEARAATLTNIQFHDLQPKEQLGELLALATIHILPQKRDAADLVLPSKLTNMLASGKPVVAGAAAGCGLAREVEGCGLAVEPEDTEAMMNGIKQLLDDPALYSASAIEARRRAEQRWSRGAILDRFEALLTQMASFRRQHEGA